MVARVAALYDIHGNVPALEAVLAEVAAERFDGVVIGGDVLPGPMPSDCLERLRALALPVHYLRGNGERETLNTASCGLPPAAVEALRWTADRLGPTDRAWIARWPATVELDVAGCGRVLFCHATLGSDSDIVAGDAEPERFLAAFGMSGLVVCGHTHVQFDRTVGGVRVVNAGSVGMPFEAPGAYWLDLGTTGPRLRRTVYENPVAAITAAGFPHPEWFDASR